MRKITFESLMNNYSSDHSFISTCWNELVTLYSQPHRRYHTLAHVESMVVEFEQCTPFVTNGDAVLFAIFYHDSIYEIDRSDNEFQSAELLERRLSETTFGQIELSKTMILATKGHVHSGDFESSLFLDLDLAVLGRSREMYEEYVRNIREEYSTVPDSVFRVERAKVLRHFLARPRLFETDLFYEKFESSARENLSREISGLE